MTHRNDNPSGISAAVILDSVNPDGQRLTTLELVMPRFLLAQFNTHRQFSRNAASSRAIPTAKLIEQVEWHPFVPQSFGANQRGMQSGEALAAEPAAAAEEAWLKARSAAVDQARRLLDLGVHKQWANRLLEPFLWVKVLVSATEWTNFFRLRLHDDAQPEFQQLAQAIFNAREASVPLICGWNEPHMPYITEEEWGDEREGERPLALDRWSVARCARLGRATPEKDEELYERLLKGSGFGHWSPFEHVAQSIKDATNELCGNFRGWLQFRKTFPGECG